MDRLKNAEIESRRVNKKMCTDDDSLSEDGENELQVTLGNRLSEDELTLIFSSYWIFTQDLLNLRLVSKLWRDVATTILRRRDACRVTLVAKSRTAKKGGDDVVAHGIIEPFFYKYGDKVEACHMLSQLTELISNSPNFPVSNFRVQTPFKRNVDYTHYPDLVLFFKLHGDKIKTFCPQSCVSQEQLLDICFIYAPKLECLDLSGAVACSNIEKGIVPLKLPSKILPCKSIIFGHGELYTKMADTEIETGAYQELIHLILSSPSKLRNIEVTPRSLAHVLEEGKGDLVRSFDFHDEKWSAPSIALVGKYLELTTSPILSKLSLDLSDFNWNKMTLCPITALISACRTTVQDLTLQYPLAAGALANGSVRLKIPPMKNLKTILLSVSNTGPYSEFADDRKPYFVFEFEDGIPGQSYFPSLLKVKMKSGDFTCLRSLPSFFHDLPKKKLPLPNVDILEIDTFFCEEPMDFEYKFTFTRFPQKVFPNLRVLKFSWGNITSLTSSMWMLRSLEFIEIYHISRNQRGLSDLGLVPFVDQFFTGFGLDICRKFETTGLPRNMDTPESLKLLRVRPSICDLQNLKELKLKFSSSFSVQFASRLGAYAFSKMLHTKFIISYDPDKINSSTEVGAARESKIERYEELCFGRIKRYVQIIHEEQQH